MRHALTVSVSVEQLIRLVINNVYTCVWEDVSFTIQNVGKEYRNLLMLRKIHMHFKKKYLRQNFFSIKRHFS